MKFKELKISTKDTNEYYIDVEFILNVSDEYLHIPYFYDTKAKILRVLSCTGSEYLFVKCYDKNFDREEKLKRILNG